MWQDLAKSFTFLRLAAYEPLTSRGSKTGRYCLLAIRGSAFEGSKIMSGLGQQWSKNIDSVSIERSLSRIHVPTLFQHRPDIGLIAGYLSRVWSTTLHDSQHNSRVELDMEEG